MGRVVAVSNEEWVGSTETRCFDCEAVFRVSWLLVYPSAVIECPKCGSRRARVIDISYPHYIRTMAGPKLNESRPEHNPSFGLPMVFGGDELPTATQRVVSETLVTESSIVLSLEFSPLQRVYIGVRNAIAALDRIRESSSDAGLAYEELDAACDRVWHALTDAERNQLLEGGVGQRD